MKKAILFVAGLLTSSALFGAEQKATLSVPTMNCATCPITVKKSLEKVSGVKSVNVSYKTKLANVVYEDLETNIDALINATTQSGYPSVIVESSVGE